MTASDLRGFHDGELAVQQRAGVRRAADRLEGMLDAPALDGGAGRFLGERTFAALTAHDATGRLWTSPLTGAPGFLETLGSSTLRVAAGPGVGDPLHALPAGQPVGMIAIEFSRRRRFRVNGTLTAVGEDLLVEVDQAYGNCPQYIHPRVLETGAPGDVARGRRGDGLDAQDTALIGRADTFFLGTVHPERGADASHKGGPAGFVRVEDERTLWWPDYAGNNMFNSLGNLVVDPAVALLFVDFTTGATLQLSGTARLDWHTDPDVEGGTGRRVVVRVDAVSRDGRVPLRAA
ncbi:pyridoxamine 5'-phosphate oxidase family protein [Actinomycetospora flava]|uniref:Pyridoxamine 5'-phosphate oxidase family protein n=1 Tax=Actinomycetospora flava TaxID=3129232 RepID=A0ABU8M9Q4_9PSEU